MQLFFSVAESWTTQEELNHKLGEVTAEYLMHLFMKVWKWGDRLGTCIIKYGQQVEQAASPLDVVQLSGVIRG